MALLRIPAHSVALQRVPMLGTVGKIQMGYSLIDISIEGSTPLLCNRFTADSEQKVEAGGGSSFTGDAGTPREQSERKLYRDVDGKLVIPTPNLLRCFIDAGTFFKLGRSKVSTQKNSLIPACFEIVGIDLPIEHRDPWQVDSRPIRNPVTGGRRLCHRPMFQDWRLTFTLKIDTSIMPVKMAREIIDAAGKRIGLGDFRPDRKGPFGKFVVVAWADNATKAAA